MTFATDSGRITDNSEVTRLAKGCRQLAHNGTARLAHTALVAIRQDYLFNSQTLKDLIDCH